MSGPVLLTGAAGRIGTVLRGGLPERGWAVRCLDVVPIVDTRPGEEQVVADVTDLAAVVDAAEGAGAVVHLAGISGESTWPAISHANIQGTYSVLEAARRAGIPRVVLASSNHATGFTPRPDGRPLREDDGLPRPDTYYGVSKAAMEALGSLYADRYGMDVVCLRIGSAFPEPTTVRMLATWLSPGDQVSLVDAALRAPAPGFAVVWGVSANTRNWWDLTAARALGYEPADDAEVFAEALIEAAPRGDVAPGSGASE
jgi:uronate dehydrogenase